MKKRKILFLIGALDTGGVAKSLINTLNAVDFSCYDVTLFILSGHQGVFSKYIPKQINVFIHEQAVHATSIKGILYFFKHMQLHLAVIAMLRILMSRIDKGWAGWLLSRLYPGIANEWDMIVDYNGQQQLYYMIDKLKARRKVTFFHSDYAKWSYYEHMDRKYFPKVDAIFTISQQCVRSLKSFFPEVESKIQLFENITSPELIHQLASQAINDMELEEHVFTTIGHVWKNKGVDLAIEAATLLKQKGIKFSWLFIGNVLEPQWLNVVAEHGLEKNMKFLGIQSNPYPYIQRADVLVHPSRFEGKSIALDEAKILCKPVVVTNFSTVHDQFEDRVNGSICAMSGQDLAEKIEELLNDAKLRQSYVDTLKKQIVDNSTEICKLYQICEY